MLFLVDAFVTFHCKYIAAGPPPGTRYPFTKTQQSEADPPQTHNNLALQPFRLRPTLGHPLIQRDAKRRHNLPHDILDSLPLPFLNPLRSLLRRKEAVFNHVALDECLIWIVDERLGWASVVFLEEAVEVLAVCGRGDGFAHCVRADYGAGYAAGGLEEIGVGGGRLVWI